MKTLIEIYLEYRPMILTLSIKMVEAPTSYEKINMYQITHGNAVKT